jgi:phosphopantothenoylcysteine decarboxylase / phosphopantothenate---cysteine ligase
VARILIGVSGGIAAYKAVELARLATQAGHGVRVTMTDAAARFVGAATFEGITGAPVLVDEFNRDPLRGTYPGDELPAHDPISHLAVVEHADVFAVAPASANTLAKLAVGICDSFLTTSFLACTAPRIIAPAMNGRMWEAAATGANVAALRERGIEVMEPGEGALASRGEHGRGRMPEPEEILAAIEAATGANPDSANPASPADLAGRRVVVTAGGTREPIDPVRFVGNRSSGRMGVALAEAAARRGAEVTLIAANVALPVAAGVERVDVTSAAELEAATAKAFDGADLLLMAAAVADFRPADPNPGKLAREEGSGMTLELEPTADVLAGLAGNRRNGQVLVGFAAEHGGDFVARARGKLERKGIDAIVVNDVSDSTIGFESSDNEVTIVSTAGEERLPRGSKRDLADAILDRVLALR